MTRLPRVLTLSPAGLPDARFAVAGSRAGGLGVIDLATRFQAEPALKLLNRVGALLKDRRFGIRLRPEELTGSFLRSTPDQLGCVIVPGGVGSDWTTLAGEIRRFDRIPVAEVTSRESAAAAISGGFDSLILTGHEAGGWVSGESSFILLQAVLAQAKSGCRIWVRGGIGPAVAAGCVAGGAWGVVLDGALLLTRESPLPASIRERLAHWDGVESSVFGGGSGKSLREAMLLRDRASLKTIRDAFAKRERMGGSRRALDRLGRRKALAGRSRYGVRRGPGATACNGWRDCHGRRTGNR